MADAGMADYSVDFEKVDAAFQHLADSDEGNEALAQLSEALEAVGRQAERLNEHEVHYLLTNLVQQREPGYGPQVNVSQTRGTKSVRGFLIMTAVK